MEVEQTELGSKFDRKSLRAAELAHFIRKNPIVPEYNPYSFTTDKQLDVVLKNVEQGMTVEQAMENYFEGKDKFLELYHHLKSPNGKKIRQPKAKHLTVTKTIDDLFLIVNENSFYAGIQTNNNGEKILSDYASTMSPWMLGMYAPKHDFMFVRENPVKVLISYLDSMQNRPPSAIKDERAAGIKAYGKYLQEGGSKSELLECVLKLNLAHERGEKTVDDKNAFTHFQEISDFFAGLETVREYERIGIQRLNHGMYAIFTQCLNPKVFHKKDSVYFSLVLMLGSLYLDKPSEFYEKKLNLFEKQPSQEKLNKMMAEAQSILWTQANGYLQN